MVEKEIRFDRKRYENDDKSSSREEFEVDDVIDDASPGGGSFARLTAQLESRGRLLRPESVITGIRDLSKGFSIQPDKTRWYGVWTKFILLWAVYSSFFTPMEFGFFRGLPKNLFFLDIAGQVAFCVDIFLQFFVAYRDKKTYRMVYKRKLIALRYLKSCFITDFLACMPWDIIYKACGRKEEVRYLVWIRLTRVRKMVDFFQHLEKDIRINYMFTRILKLIAVELYCTHTAACFFYYLATTIAPEEEGYSWIGSLKMGDYSYSHFREIDIWKRYTTSLYFAIVTMATVGYGDIHAVNLREMIFVMAYVSFDMILGAYLLGNMTALIVKGSNTERFRDKMTDIMKFMNRNRLGKEIRDQIKGHMRLQYESSYTEAAVLQELPISIRAKISQCLYQHYIEVVPLFEGCSSEFINQIVTKVHDELFLPGEVIMEQGNVVDQLYFVCHGELDVIKIGEDGFAETVSPLLPKSSFGEISILCNIPQPYTVRVSELCRLLRIDKHSFSNIFDLYFFDGRKILNNLLEAKKTNLQVKELESEVTFYIGRHEAELALKVNNASYHGDLFQIKGLIRAGANPKKTDYDGRSPLHIAASKGYEDVTLFLVQEGVDLNLPDVFGNTPLLEAIKNGHDRVASILVKKGATLQVSDTGSFLCSIVSKGDSEFLKRILANGLDPNSKDCDQRTPLHIAAFGGLYFMAKLLIEYKASVFSKDRWGNTPIDEGRMSGNNNLLKLLEDARSEQFSTFSHCSQDVTGKEKSRKKCTVFPFEPWDGKAKEGRKHGIVLWVRGSIQELIKEAAKQLMISRGDNELVLVSEDGGQIVDVELIDDAQRLYLSTTASP